MGAILAQGIMDIGGRNAITSMVSRGGFVKQSAVVGMAMWLQHWYWYPLLHFLSLAVSPTPLIGLVGDFRVPKDYKVICQCRPSWFAYPPALEEKKEDKSAKVTTVELSITAKAKAKAAAKEKAKGTTPGRSSTGMDVDDSVPKPDAPVAPVATTTGASESKTDGDAKPADAPATEVKKEEKEATSFALHNMSRVTLSQTKFLDFDAAETRGQRYVPVRTVSTYMRVCFHVYTRCGCDDILLAR
jgi:26S proteasome regulatory subunit N2